MPMTLESFSRAADSLGLERRLDDEGTLVVRVRGRRYLAFESKGGGVWAEGRVNGQPVTHIIVLLALMTGLFMNLAFRGLPHFEWFRRLPQDILVAALVLGLVLSLWELVYTPLILARWKKRLFQRAQEMAA